MLYLELLIRFIEKNASPIYRYILCKFLLIGLDAIAS